MPKKSVIIIGAGLAGLSTGIYAQMNGFEALIFEHARHPGGVAATWKRRGYTIDGGIHFYMGYRPGLPTHNLYRDLGVYQQDKYVEMQQYGRYLDISGKRTVDVTQDLDRLAADLIAISPRDAHFFRKILRGAQAFAKADMSASMAKPPELTNWWNKIKMFTTMGKTLRYYAGAYLQPVEQAVKDLHDPWLKDFFYRLFLPDVPLVFVMMILGFLNGRNIALRTDGSGGFTRALEKRFQDLGGRVTYNAMVDEILVQNDRAIGVKLVKGESCSADYVVAAGDGHSTLFKLLKGSYVSPQMREMHDNWTLFKPVVMVNFGVNRTFGEEPWFVSYKPDQKITAGFLADDWLPVRIFNYGPGYAPEGKVLIQVMIESAWQPWRELHEDKDAYNREKQQLAEQVAAGLAELWPGLTEQIEMTDVATPYTWWRYTLNRRGAYEGFAVTPDIFSIAVNRTLPGLGHFVMAGQWTVPGGGVVPSLMTGRHAVMLLCKQEGQRFGSEFATM